MSFLEKFDKEFAPKLARRAKTFRRIFEELENRAGQFAYIIETGCARNTNGWSGDGMSTVLFDAYVNYHDGMVLSADIDKKACDNADKLTSNKTTVCCEDSVQFLWKLEPEFTINLLYLDSFDINFSKPHPSAMHHTKEFMAILPWLDPGTIVVVDDQNGKVGKGMYIAEFLEGLGYERFIDDYQIGWIL
ncbi:MAG: hypothetical protein DRI84_05025 [Bacteroidetes bacterium]|nr:MAG: hypothetical protein DRI84_05025 [Bacteroidota bacterium]